MYLFSTAATARVLYNIIEKLYHLSEKAFKSREVYRDLKQNIGIYIIKKN